VGRCKCRYPAYAASKVGYFFFSSRRRHTRFSRDWSSDVCSSDLSMAQAADGKLFTDEGLPTGGPGWDEIDFPDFGQEKVFALEEIGRASCRERVWIAVYVVARTQTIS